MKWSALLRLGRVSNLPTVWSNVIAGAVLSGAAYQSGQLALLGLSLSAFYVGGMFLNDAFDREFDAKHRPERPIVRGEVRATQVFAWGFALLAVGVCGVFGAGSLWLGRPPWLALGAALGLAALIVYYNVHHKGNPLSPLIMGLCRVGVYACAGLALIAHPSPRLWWGAGSLLAYLIGLTYVAKQETLSRVQNLWPLAFLFLPFAWVCSSASPSALTWVLLAVLALWVLRALSFLRRGAARPPQIPRAVVSLIAGIALLDAALIASTGNMGLALVAVVCFALTLFLQRYVSGT